MTTSHGFELIDERRIEELDTLARRYRHVRSGAELLSLINDDTNKVFGITFRTPPADSTGLPHILEHSVLCGSEKYPVKEPFVELVKGSLNTFVNAFTYPDKTCYPVASQNVQDFYNLIDVYLDSVFHPRLSPEILKQEGWHYEVDGNEMPLRLKGVVFNEMKGALASPERVLMLAMQKALFPDNAYALDSGGDPRVIPDLTWEQFERFHQRYYHPSNARIFFYGNDDPERRLALLDEVLSEYSQIEIDSEIALQPPHDEPTSVHARYAVGEDEALDRKGIAALAWALAEPDDPERTLALYVLSYLLVGSPAAPLRKALLDSGLGEGLAARGLEAHFRQMVFWTGLKGIRVQNAPRVESLILETLERLADEGIEREMIDAALNATEFRLRENNTGSYPQGLVVMLNALATWLHDYDPLALLAFEAPLARIRERIEAEEPLFESLIRDYLLDNPHRSTIVLEPDPGLDEARERAERERLAAYHATLNEADMARIADEAAALRELQQQPDSPEALATIPRLSLDDLDHDAPSIPIEELELGGARTFYHDIATHGIVYLDLGLDLHTLPQNELPLAPILGRALLQMGTRRESYVELLQRIDRESGGLYATPYTTVVRGRDEAEARLFLRGKATVAQLPALLEILHDVLLEARLDDRERFRQLLLEEKVALEAAIVPKGHVFTHQRLRAAFYEAGWASEQLEGLSQLFALRDLEKRVEQDWASLLETLERMRAHLVDRGTLLANVTIDEGGWAEIEPALSDFLGDLPAPGASRTSWEAPARPELEGLTIAAPVNYVGKGVHLPALGIEPRGSWLVAARHLGAAYMWDRIRVQGGAYGGFSVLDRISGSLAMLSYRDPNLLETLDVYNQAAAFIREHPPTPVEIERAIIGTIGDLDKYQLPDARGYTSMGRALARVSEAERQQRRDEVLATSQGDFRAYADALAALRDHGRVVVLSAAPTLEGLAGGEMPQLEITRLQ